MFEPNDEAFLLRQISQNSCILFLGAGFCWGMKNRLDQRPPLGRELTGELWKYAGYSDPMPAGMSDKACEGRTAMADLSLRAKRYGSTMSGLSHLSQQPDLKHAGCWKNL